MYETKPYFYGTGRRKNSVARVRVYTGTGKITINDRDIDDYFGLETLKLIVRQPLAVAEVEGKFDIVVRVNGGGVAGQAGAIRHGLSRALLREDYHISVGIQCETDVSSLARLIKRAEQKMYAEKKKYYEQHDRRGKQYAPDRETLLPY